MRLDGVCAAALVCGRSVVRPRTASTEFAIEYGSRGDWLFACTVWAGMDACPFGPLTRGTWYCFCVTDRALSNSPAVPLAWTSTLSLRTFVVMPNLLR